MLKSLIEKPYKYDEWLESMRDEYNIIDKDHIINQFVSVSLQYQRDPKSNASKGFWDNGLKYVSYYIQEVNKQIEDNEESEKWYNT